MTYQIIELTFKRPDSKYIWTLFIHMINARYGPFHVVSGAKYKELNNCVYTRINVESSLYVRDVLKHPSNNIDVRCVFCKHPDFF